MSTNFMDKLRIDESVKLQYKRWENFGLVSLSSSLLWIKFLPEVMTQLLMIITIENENEQQKK